MIMFFKELLKNNLRKKLGLIGNEKVKTIDHDIIEALLSQQKKPGTKRELSSIATNTKTLKLYDDGGSQ